MLDIVINHNFVNIILNIVLMNLMGLPGIALATTGVYFCSAIVLMSLVYYRMRKEMREGNSAPRRLDSTPTGDDLPMD